MSASPNTRYTNEQITAQLLEALQQSQACLQALAEIHIGNRAVSARIDIRLKKNAAAISACLSSDVVSQEGT